MPKKWLKKEETTARPGHRLRLEPLEARRLLAGLQVSVFVDQDGSRTYDAATDSAAGNRLVFIDLNSDGAHSQGEPLQVTSEDGTAFFDGLEVGDYTLGLLSNSEVQKQVSSVGVSATAEQVIASESSRLLATPFHSELWAIDSRGVAQNLNDPSQSIDFGGSVVAATGSGAMQHLLIDRNDALNEVVEFDLLTGGTHAASVAGLANGESLSGLHSSSTDVWAVITSSGAQAVARLEFGDGSIETIDRIELGSGHIATAEAADWLASTSAYDGSNTYISLRNLNQGGDEITVYEQPGEVAGLTFSPDGGRLFVSLSSGGVNVLSIHDEQITLEALLADAAGPISADSLDGRIVTASSASGDELIVWDTANWSRVGLATVSGADRISELTADMLGDRVLAVANDGIYSIAMDVEVNPVVELTSSASIAHRELGVRLVKENNLPETSVPLTREAIEDQPDAFAPENLELEDPDGDSLWFTVQTPPSNGELQLDEAGWTYLPKADFSGKDQATIRVHDGVGVTELQLEWNVLAINDPPQDILLQVPELGEDAGDGHSVGFLAVVDPDLDAAYKITTSDSRFEVQNGQIVFTGGELDFESESEITFQVRAVDVQDSTHQIETDVTVIIGDVNEAPAGLSLDGAPIQENEFGAVVGSIEVFDPDSDSDYEFQVSDSRFEIVDGVLKLVAGAAIDYESEQKIELKITASDSSQPENKVSEDFTVEISNSDEPPVELLLDRLAVASETPGAVVGTVAVTDPDGDKYDFTVSDNRFEVVGDVLKLKGDQSLDKTGQISLSITAKTLAGVTISRAFPIVVSLPMSSHQNQHNPSDVNNDGMVTPIDALIIVNELNSGGGGPLPSDGDGEISGHLMDVNGDGVLSPMDVLIIINELNNGGLSGSAGEGEFVGLDNQEPIYGPIIDPSHESNRRDNSSIDSELELLLNELSQYRNGNDLS